MAEILTAYAHTLQDPNNVRCYSNAIFLPGYRQPNPEPSDNTKYELPSPGDLTAYVRSVGNSAGTTTLELGLVTGLGTPQDQPKIVAARVADIGKSVKADLRPAVDGLIRTAEKEGYDSVPQPIARGLQPNIKIIRKDEAERGVHSIHYEKGNPLFGVIMLEIEGASITGDKGYMLLDLEKRQTATSPYYALDHCVEGIYNYPTRASSKQESRAEAMRRRIANPVNHLSSLLFSRR